jgi:hypothetical protein
VPGREVWWMEEAEPRVSARGPLSWLLLLHPDSAALAALPFSSLVINVPFESFHRNLEAFASTSIPSFQGSHERFALRMAASWLLRFGKILDEAHDGNPTSQPVGHNSFLDTPALHRSTRSGHFRDPRDRIIWIQPAQESRQLSLGSSKHSGPALFQETDTSHEILPARIGTEAVEHRHG